MESLAELLEQRRAIDEKIRQLKSASVIIGHAKLDVEQYPTKLPDRHFIAVKSDYCYNGVKSQRWKSIISGSSPNECMKQLPPIVEDLQRLYNHFYNHFKEDSQNVQN